MLESEHKAERSTALKGLAIMSYTMPLLEIHSGKLNQYNTQS